VRPRNALSSHLFFLPLPIIVCFCLSSGPPMPSSPFLLHEASFLCKIIRYISSRLVQYNKNKRNLKRKTVRIGLGIYRCLDIYYTMECDHIGLRARPENVASKHPLIRATCPRGMLAERATPAAVNNAAAGEQRLRVAGRRASRAPVYIALPLPRPRCCDPCVWGSTYIYFPLR
jgi:hypothetical protein